MILFIVCYFKFLLSLSNCIFSWILPLLKYTLNYTYIFLFSHLEMYIHSLAFSIYSSFLNHFSVWFILSVHCIAFAAKLQMRSGDARERMPQWLAQSGTVGLLLCRQFPYPPIREVLLAIVKRIWYLPLLRKRVTPIKGHFYPVR